MFQAFSKIRKVGKVPPKTPTKLLKSAPTKQSKSPNHPNELVSTFAQTQKLSESKVVDIAKVDNDGQEFLTELYNQAIPVYETEKSKYIESNQEVQKRLQEEEAKQKELQEQIERNRLAALQEEMERIEKEKEKEREKEKEKEREKEREREKEKEREQEKEKIKQSQSSTKKKQLMIDTDQLNNSISNQLSTNNKKAKEKKDNQKKEIKSKQAQNIVQNSRPKKLNQNLNQRTTHSKSHHSISPKIKHNAPDQNTKKQTILINKNQQNQNQGKTTSRSQNSISPSMNNLVKNNKASEYLKLNQVNQESSRSARSQHSTKLIDHQIQMHQQSNISVRSEHSNEIVKKKLNQQRNKSVKSQNPNERAKKNQDITDLAVKFKQIENRFQNQKQTKKEVIQPKKWFQVSPKKQQKTQQDYSPQQNNILSSPIGLQENSNLNQSDENIVQQLVGQDQEVKDKMLLIENNDDEQQEEPEQNIPEFQRMPSLNGTRSNHSQSSQRNNYTERQVKENSFQENRKAEIEMTNKDSFQLKYKNPDSTRNNQQNTSINSNDFMGDSHIPLHLRYQSILQRREQQLEYQRQRKKQIEKEKEDRSLTFRPDLSLTKKDKKTRAVNEFIKDQEDWSESKKRMNNLRKEQIEQKEIYQNTFSPYLSEKSRQIALAKNERLGSMKTEDRLFEQHIITQEKLRETRERTQPTFKPTIDQNSRNIVKQKRSQYNSQNSSMVNEQSQ